MKIIRISLVAALILSLESGTLAKEKRILDSDNILEYKVLPKDVDNLSDLFKEGVFYGRVRLNTFLWDWDKEIKGKTKDNWAAGVGGNVIYKSAYFKGFGMSVGFYTSQNPWHMDRKDFIYIKAADTFSKLKVSRGGSFSINTLAQAYIEYKNHKTSVKYGRQIFESLLAKSNDSKMIPNTFEGWSLVSGYFPKTTMKAAYFTKQKLRDHEDFHDVITYKDASGNKYANNDDSGAHEGLSYKRLSKHGKDTSNSLIIFEVKSKSFKNLKLLANYTAVPGLIHFISTEAHYGIKIDKNFKVVPGIRYIKQIDDGAGEVGGASIEKKTAGYRDKHSLDSYLLGVRVDFKTKALLFRVGYTEVEDKGDIVNPWRGHPTSGFSRGMSRKNWYADTKSYMLKVGFDLDKLGILDGAEGEMKYIYEDYDDKKSATPPDSKVYYAGLFQKVKSVKGLYLKFRAERVDQKKGVVDIKGKEKLDKSFNQFRFEVNYLF
ncbi:MAG: OprD family porin [Epsilonproteobacteria bacterium]|nr:OprD family porin [Campylobacterota bacterium]